MPDPCRQEPTIRQLQEEIGDAMREMRDDQRRQTAMLERLVLQSARLDHAETDLARHEKSITTLYDRQRMGDQWRDQMEGSLRMIKGIPILCSVISAMAALVAIVWRA